YGAGFTLQFVQNVIIHNIHIHRIVPSSGGLIRDSEDHFGYRTAVQGSTAITISNCHFTHHDAVMLLGASDNYSKDQFMQVTLAFNHFGKELLQRMPRCRWGFFHVVNNDYTHWKMYAI
ncbi:hypothetical protein Gogos_017639, partial [Gossypium gossypioides]|nr:hypothetical protein [Gossypium gossypioides]